MEEVETKEKGAEDGGFAAGGACEGSEEAMKRPMLSIQVGRQSARQEEGLKRQRGGVGALLWKGWREGVAGLQRVGEAWRELCFPRRCIGCGEMLLVLEPSSGEQSGALCGEGDSLSDGGGEKLRGESGEGDRSGGREGGEGGRWGGREGGEGGEFWEGRGWEELCEACEQAIWPLGGERCCSLCAMPCVEGERWLSRRGRGWWLDSQALLHRCTSCGGKGLGMGEVFALFVYGGVLREILQRWKYERDALAGKALCGWMREEAEARALSLGAYDAILPVPLSWSRLRWRGFHPAWMLTRSLKPLTKTPMYPMLLRRKHQEGHQAGRSRIERLQSLQGLISVAPWAASSLKGARILLIDDVFTTGATLQECSLALLQAGAAQVDALCLCRAL